MKTLHCLASRFFVVFIAIIFSCSAISTSLAVEAVAEKKPTQVQLKSFIATYMVSTMGLKGINVTTSLTINSSEQVQRYHFKSYSIPVGLLALQKDETRDEQSEGLIVNALIQPERYSYLQVRNGNTRRNVELKFDWKKKQVSNHHKHKNSKWSMSIPEKTLDKLSYQLSLMLVLAEKKTDKQFSLPIADGGKLKHYNFTVLGKEQVITKAGTYQAIKVRHQRYKKDKIITLWCAPELNYLPVKIIQDEIGKPQFISSLTSYKNQ